MSKKGLQKRGMVRRQKMLSAAIELFLEQGYEKTSTTQIAKAAGMSQTSFFAAFENKEALLLELVKLMFENQFSGAARMMEQVHTPVLLYAIETGLQLYITELSETLRELYVMAYTLPSTSEYVYRNTAQKLQHIFQSYLPDQKESDFYEMDIASSNIMRGFMAKRCDLYFTIEQKVRRYLNCCLRMYCVPKQQIAEVIAAVETVDLEKKAKDLIAQVVKQAKAEMSDTEDMEREGEFDE